MITQDELLKLRENLPKNHLSTIHSRLNGKFSKSLIEKVLRGTRNNDIIIEYAIELAHQDKIKKAALQERIHSLT